MIVGLYGLKGSGKTLMMVILLWLEYTHLHSKVMANLKLSFKHEIIDIKELVELNKHLINSAIGIDELHTICDSRQSGTNKNILMSYFVLQSRHRSVNFYFTDQFEHQVEKRIRENTDIKIVMENCHIDSDGDGIDDVFRVIVQDLRTAPIEYYVTHICGTQFFNMYDTDYIVDIFKYKKHIKDKVKKIKDGK